MPHFSRSLIIVAMAFGLALASSQNVAGERLDGTRISSIRDGDWSSSSTWKGAAVPGPEDAVTIKHTVVYDLAKSRVSGVTIVDAGRLAFAPTKSVTLETDRNLINCGKLEMRPASPAILHRLRFVDVDETKFVGGGMDILDTDVGLWTTGSGLLDAVGAAKTPWTRLVGGARGGDARITVRDAQGWQVGDVIVIVPTERPAVGDRAWNGFEERRIEGIDGGTIDLDGELDNDHPEVDNPFNDDAHAAEVLNLSRNVRIEGTGSHAPSFEPSQNGRAHVIFLATKRPQIVKYVELGHLGPRQPDGRYTMGVEGRYPFHFHHAQDGSRGSLIEGVVARQSGNRGFVPHASHGITLRATIAYDVFATPYWWDSPEGGKRNPDLLNINNTDDLLIDHAVAARVLVDPAFRGYRLSGFTLTRGKDRSLTLRDSVAVGVQGRKNASGFLWPERGQAIWNFDGNIAHNNKVDGIFVWQNNSDRHEIKRFVAYHNGGGGIDHGAYGNNFQYSDLFLFGNGEAGFFSRAASSGYTLRKDGYAQAIERLRTTGTFAIGEHNAGYTAPTLVKDSVVGHVDVDERGKERPGRYDFVNVTTIDGSSIEPSDFTLVAPKLESVYRVQRPDGTAFRIAGDKTVMPIDAFYDLPVAGAAPDARAANDTLNFAGSLVERD